MIRRTLGRKNRQRAETINRRYRLDLIMAYLPVTSQTEAALQVLVMNVAFLLRVLLRFFLSLLECVFGARVRHLVSF